MSWELPPGEEGQWVALSPEERALALVQLAADWDEVWGLKDDAGWIVSRHTDALPLWPHPAFAEACAHGDWEGAVPTPLPLDDLLEDLLPLLEEDGLRIALFPTPDDPGLLLAPAGLRDRLLQELEIGEE